MSTLAERYLDLNMRLYRMLECRCRTTPDCSVCKIFYEHTDDCDYCDNHDPLSCQSCLKDRTECHDCGVLVFSFADNYIWDDNGSWYYCATCLKTRKEKSIEEGS